VVDAQFRPAERRASVRTPEIPAIHPARDGLVGFSLVTGQQWLDFCSMLGREDWRDDPELSSMRGRAARRSGGTAS